MPQNLHFNLLTFTQPTNDLTLYFSKDEDGTLVRCNKITVPEEVVEHFGEKDFYYTSLTRKTEGYFPVTKKTVTLKTTTVTEDGEEVETSIPNSAFSFSLLRKHYNSLISEYFRNLGCLVMPNFINATEVWLPTIETGSEPQYNFYKKFTVKVQQGVITKGWEILLVYEGKSKVFKKSVLELSDEVSPSAYKYIVFRNGLYTYRDRPQIVSDNLKEAYPVWNLDIRREMNLPTPAPDRINKYVKFKSEIDKFYSRFLNTPSFKELFPPIENGFARVPEKTIGNVSDSSNSLIFGGGKPGVVPHLGLQNYGPNSFDNAAPIEFFYIFHSADKDAVLKVHDFFKGDEIGFSGLSSFIKAPYHANKNLKIEFVNKDKPWPEIYSALNDLDLKDGVKYVAIYLSPVSKDNANQFQKETYFKLKEALLKKEIVSQVISADKVRKSKTFQFSAMNIATALVAKLDGIPWKLNTAPKKELIVGVGAFSNPETKVRYIASAFSFTNTGKFNRFDHFYANQTRELAGSILATVKEYTSLDPSLSRLIIHFYKTMSREELEPIERGLISLDVNIPVFIVTVNKTESTDIVAFDTDCDSLMPDSGKFINLGRNKYLLFNNSKYKGKYYSGSDGWPFPIKIQIYCSDYDLAQDFTIRKELIEQVYQFSRMYWKSVRQQNLPVTLKYSQMVAEMLPYFSGNSIPDFGKDKLWFL